MLQNFWNIPMRPQVWKALNSDAILIITWHHALD